MTTMLRRLVCASIVAMVTGTAHAQDAPAVDFAWRDHPSVEIGGVRLELTARAETDARLAAPAVGRDRAELWWQDPRVEIRGRMTRRIDFEVFPPKGAGQLCWLGASQIAPSRDTGVMLHGRLLGRRLRYQAGVFERDGDNARTAQALGGRRTVALRLVAAPWSRGSGENAARLQMGVAVALSRVDDRLGLRGQTLMEDGTFFDRVYVNGRRRRTGLEVFWPAGPASLAAEYMRVSDERDEMGFRGEDLSAVHASAWSVAGTWAITGERKDGRLEPRRPLARGGFRPSGPCRPGPSGRCRTDPRR